MLMTGGPCTLEDVVVAVTHDCTNTLRSFDFSKASFRRSKVEGQVSRPGSTTWCNQQLGGGGRSDSSVQGAAGLQMTLCRIHHHANSSAAFAACISVVAHCWLAGEVHFAWWSSSRLSVCLPRGVVRVSCRVMIH
jgi:hypothetical protein